MLVRLSEGEVNVVRLWADSNIHGGHWGDGDFMVPEEDIILQKLEKAKDGMLNISENEARIILTWSESSHGIHTMEEESVIRKLKSLFNSGE